MYACNLIYDLLGLLSGKYNDGIIPPYTRLAIQDHPVINRLRAGFFSEEGRRKLEKIKMVCVSRQSKKHNFFLSFLYSTS